MKLYKDLPSTSRRSAYDQPVLIITPRSTGSQAYHLRLVIFTQQRKVDPNPANVEHEDSQPLSQLQLVLRHKLRENKLLFKLLS